MDQVLTPKLDYYLNADGMMVFTEHFLLKRGYCCHSGCQHCPYEQGELVSIDPLIPIELQIQKSPSDHYTSELESEYICSEGDDD